MRVHLACCIIESPRSSLKRKRSLRGVEPGIQEVACKSFGGEEETAGYQRRGIKKEAEGGGGKL